MGATLEIEVLARMLRRQRPLHVQDRAQATARSDQWWAIACAISDAARRENGARFDAGRFALDCGCPGMLDLMLSRPGQ